MMRLRFLHARWHRSILPLLLEIRASPAHTFDVFWDWARRYCFTVALLALIGAKLLHLYAHLHSLPAAKFGVWGITFFFQDVVILLLLRMATHKMRTRTVAAIAAGVVIPFTLIMSGMASANASFYVVTGAEIHWRQAKTFHRDAAAIRTLLTGLTGFLIVETILLGTAWLIARPIHRAAGGILKVLGWPWQACTKCFFRRHPPLPDPERYERVDVDEDSSFDENKSDDDGESLRPFDSVSGTPTSRSSDSVVRRLAILLPFVVLFGMRALRPSDPSYLFLSGALPLTPFAGGRYRLSPVDPTGMPGDYRFLEGKTALTVPPAFSWLPQTPLPGFEDWDPSNPTRLHYDPVADPLHISNADQPVLEPIRGALADSRVRIKHVILLKLESTRADLFPLIKDSYLWKRVMGSYERQDVPKEVTQRVANLTRTAEFLTGFDSGFDHKDNLFGGKKAYGGISARNAVTTGTYTLKSIVGSVCGVTPLVVDFNREYDHHIYQPCLPHVLNAMNQQPDITNDTDDFTRWPWHSKWMQSVTDTYDNQDQLTPVLGYHDILTRERLQEKDAKHYPTKAKEVNYYGYPDTELREYLRDAIDDAERNHTRLFLTHLTGTTHHPWGMPNDDYQKIMGSSWTGTNGDMNRYLNTIKFVDDWLAEILAILEEKGIANETLIAMAGDHGLSLPNDGGLTPYDNPHIGSFHIPLVLAHPQLPPVEVTTPVMSDQIVPTILDLLVESSSLSPNSTAVATDVRPMYEGQSLIRPLVTEKTLSHSGVEKTMQDWQFTVMNTGGSWLAVRSAARPEYRLVIPLIDDLEWRFTNLHTDPDEVHPVKDFSLVDLAKTLDQDYGDDAVRFLRDAAHITECQEPGLEFLHLSGNADDALISLDHDSPHAIEDPSLFGHCAICVGAGILVLFLATALLYLQPDTSLIDLHQCRPSCHYLVLFLMNLLNRLFAAAFAAGTLLQSCRAQASAPVVYTDPDTGIVFDTWTVPESTTAAGMTFGVALPSDALTTDATEFIGYLECALDTSAGGWCGLSMGGTMTNKLLFMAYPYEDTVLTSFRFGSGYVMPDLYTGNATVTQISSTVSDTSFTLLFRCQDCLLWDQDGQTGSATTSAGRLVLGWAQAAESPTSPSCPDDLSLVQHDGFGIWVATLGADAASASYEDWTALANQTVPGDCDGGGGSEGPEPVPIPDGLAYDYIVVGGGAAGLPLVDRLSEAGKSVLLIERGPVSSGRWGGTIKPEWLDGTNLTRFDVPGLCNEIWVDSDGIACDYTDQMAGCVLGGGTAVNAGLWWKPYYLDWDLNFPGGWGAGDMQAATDKVFSRIPGTTTPSMDGQLYLQEGPNTLAKALQAGGYHSTVFNDNPTQKNHTYGSTPFMYSNGERGGPLATYLVSASGRDNFDMWTNTSVTRVIRSGGQVTGVEVEPILDGGYGGVVNLADAGRVILSAGSFGSARVLMRSGIGPSDQLTVVQNSASDGDTMIAESEWIELPVGKNLVDHVNTDIVLSHPDVVFYDYYAAYDDPIQADADSYLNGRIGPLAQAAPNIGPNFFDQIFGSDGILRQINWQPRVEGSHDFPDGNTITMSQYLGRGSTSRGRMTLTAGLDTIVSTPPYLIDQADTDAVIQGIINLQGYLKGSNFTWLYPAPNVTVADFVNDMPKTPAVRRSNHWMGTCKMGSDDGRSGGSAVVDLNTKVYGMDNLFVVDASIFPGMVTPNPSAYIVTVAEHAVQKILAL
ncbi:hypothetical protein FE257_001040 [Aspergillus nanangensis]|uniref:Glucose-methanol-choline oxidoreductase N-terminal domain-containing protein n=1 Tax=Aspergillus nanangensis TaxID=2582783 RepID=A0AAD4CVN4_ASPNN|nr:hypothetical protein FE257_001040 [Aspergillus nanangensis]